MKFIRSHWLPLAVFAIVLLTALHEMPDTPLHPSIYGAALPASSIWRAPESARLGDDSLSLLIKYGQELMAHTARFLGPKGSVAPITNGMNCQNCHLDAGAKPYGNCLSAVAATYPLFRPRSGLKESIEFRVNDCLQRSLNGKKIDTLSKEMRGIVAYLNWLGKEVPKGVRPAGAGVADLSLLSRAADPAKGMIVYQQHCSRCHGSNGEGQLQTDGIEYSYPPLWGPHSYNVSAGLYRISRLAAYARENMPFGTASHESPELTNEESWDVAAFINQQPRPVKRFKKDWPDISKKSFDYPFGPYTDGFSAMQHKYGPFEAIKKAAASAKIKLN